MAKSVKKTPIHIVSYRPFQGWWSFFSLRWSNSPTNSLRNPSISKLPNLVKIGQETKSNEILLCSNIKFPYFRPFIHDFDYFPFDQISISINYFCSIVKDVSYKFWRRLVKKQKSYDDFTVF